MHSFYWMPWHNYAFDNTHIVYEIDTPTYIFISIFFSYAFRARRYTIFIIIYHNITFAHFSHIYPAKMSSALPLTTDMILLFNGLYSATAVIYYSGNFDAKCLLKSLFLYPEGAFEVLIFSLAINFTRREIASPFRQRFSRVSRRLRCIILFRFILLILFALYAIYAFDIILINRMSRH